MKILFLLSTLDRTGPVNLTYDIIKHLPKNEFEVIILTLSPESNTSRKPDFEALQGVSVHSLNLSRLKGIFNACKLVKDFCIKNEPDAIHSEGFRSDIIAARLLNNYPRCYHIHNYPYEDYVMLYGVKGYLMAFIHLWCLRNQHTLVACSDYIAQKLTRHVNTKVEVVQNGTEEAYERLDNAQLFVLRDKLNIKYGDRVFLVAGSLIKRKNPLLIIRAFMELGRSDVVLIILGNGPLMNECARLKGSNERLHLVGHVNNVSAFMQISDYYISASLSEGLPTAVLEALNHGLPVLLSDIPQHAEILKDFPDAGMLFKSNHGQDLKRKITELLDAPYKDMRRAAIQSIRQNFNSQRMSGDFQAIYKEIIKSP
jgi:glycosyltransferase involved in cell wall biosynthesis